MSSIITFACGEKDAPIEIQLEPEAYLFVVEPGNEITFKGFKLDGDFDWTLMVNHQDKGIQLIPDSGFFSKIEIYENGVLLDDWYKYM